MSKSAQLRCRCWISSAVCTPLVTSVPPQQNLSLQKPYPAEGFLLAAALRFPDFDVFRMGIFSLPSFSCAVGVAACYQSFLLLKYPGCEESNVDGHQHREYLVARRFSCKRSFCFGTALLGYLSKIGVQSRWAGFTSAPACCSLT